MKSFKNKFVEKLVIPSRSIKQLTALAEYKGKEDLYKKQSSDTLKALLKMAIVESAEYSNRIEDIIVEHERVKALVVDNAPPQNRSEEEVAGYRDALKTIHQMHQDMPVSDNVILQLHSMIYRYTNISAGRWKEKDNAIFDRLGNGTKKLRFKTVPYQETPKYMKLLISSFNDHNKASEIDSLILIPLFVLDFLCIHPFNDGNGRIARLLTLFLLYKAGHQVGRYISLERITERSKDTYYDALGNASKNWHEGKHNPLSWFSYFYGVLLSAYKEFESRVGVFTGQGSKTEQVKTVIKEFIYPFSVSDIKKVCPNVSLDLIRKVMKELRMEGVIRCTGKGRYAKWILIR